MRISVSSKVTARRVPLADGVTVPPEWTYTLTNDEDDNRPNLILRLSADGGEVRVEELTLRAVQGGRDVRAADLGHVRLEDFREDAVARVAERTEVGPDGVAMSVRTAVDDAAYRRAVRAYRQARGRKRTPVDDATLREVAEVYRANLTGKPVQAVAEHLGCAHRTAQLRVSQARNAGLLGPAKPGRASA